MISVNRPPRFLALDSLRGVCACIVALLHLRSTGVITNLALVRNGWLFVDFFFVLSGFVIAAGYGDRLRKGFPIRRFMLLRFGRIYPLHLAVLLAFLLLELTWSVFGSAQVSGRQPFGEPRTILEFVINLGLLQIFGIREFLTWNSPSWSIAAEMWTYLLAAIALRVTGSRFPLFLMVVIPASLLIMWFTGDGALDRTYSKSLVRCVYGFGFGTLAWSVFRTRIQAISWRRSTATGIEIAIAIACALLVASSGNSRWTFLAPPVFFLAILIFAMERGAISNLLTLKPFVFVGTLSYSIYMIHSFVEARALDVSTFAGGLLGVELTKIEPYDGKTLKTFVGAGPLADISVVLTLVLVIAVAWISFRLIEKPFRELSRSYARRLGVASAERVAPAL
jgi:peptidoglycan/LPS O-acetylase OafA/YrhL